LRRVMGSSLMGILFWEENGTITDCNDAFLAMLGYTRGELAEQGLRWTTLTPPEWRDADQNALREMRARGMCTPYEKEYVRKDGARLPVFLAAATFPDAPHEG